HAHMHKFSLKYQNEAPLFSVGKPTHPTRASGKQKDLGYRCRRLGKGPSRTADLRKRRALSVSHQIQRHFQSHIDLVQQTPPMEFVQTCFLTLTEIKEKIFAVIFSAEFG